MGTKTKTDAKTEIDDAAKGKKSEAETNETTEFGAESTEEVIDEADAPKFIDPRAAAMAAIVGDVSDDRKVDEAEFKAEFGFHPDEAGGEEDDEDAGEGEGEPEVTVDNQVQDSDNPVIEHNEPQFLTLNVNGVESQISHEAAVVALQKEANADRMMQEAAQQRKLYSDLIAQQQQTSTPSTPPDEQPAVSVDTNEELKSALTKLYNGDVDEAADALGPLIKSQQQQAPPGLASPDVTQIVDQRLAAQADHQNLQSAYDRFVSSDEFSRLTSDPQLMSQVNTLTTTLQQDPSFTAKNPSYDDILIEAGRRVNTWVKSLAPEPVEEKQLSETDKRLSRKRAATSQPESRTVRRSPVPEKKVKGTHDILAEMAASRGQRNFN